MATPSPLPLLILLLVLPSPGTAQSGCTARTFSKNRTYALCNDLPVLGSTLHWTLDTASSTLRLAFSAAPDRPGGWVAWGINPSGPTMIGTQALLAFRTANASMDVATYNITASAVAKSKIAYEVADLLAEYGSDGNITIFAAVTLPAGTKKVTQVWQVGPTVTKGAPDKHAMTKANMAATGTLDLVASGGGGGGSGSGNSTSAGAGFRLRKGNVIMAWLIPCFSWSFLLFLGFWRNSGF